MGGRMDRDIGQWHVGSGSQKGHAKLPAALPTSMQSHRPPGGACHTAGSTTYKHAVTPQGLTSRKAAKPSPESCSVCALGLPPPGARGAQPDREAMGKDVLPVPATEIGRPPRVALQGRPVNH